MTAIFEKNGLETCPKNLPEKRARLIFDDSYTIFSELGRGRWEGGELGMGRWEGGELGRGRWDGGKLGRGRWDGGELGRGRWNIVLS